MKKYFSFAMMALAFTACQKDDNYSPEQNGEMEQSYVAITLTATDINTSRAADGVYEEGRDEERQVKSAYVFFFKDKAAFPVTLEDTTSTNSGNHNYLKVDLAGNEENMENVSDVKDAVLVLQNYKGEYPNQIVAVLNWDPTGQASYTLENLKAKISELGNDANGYVMSNSVYADTKRQTIDAVELTIDNIGKTAEEALANPVTIYVERVAAKVTFNAHNEGKFYVEKEIEGKPVYAKIIGFELYNDYQESWLIKRIDPNWNVGFNWNDADWHRSYWAQSLGKAFDDNTFDWNTGHKKIGEYVYCGENTRSWTEENDVRTKVIVKAQLVDEAGEPFEVVNWFGQDYIGEDELKTVVANTLKSTYFTGDGVTFTGLKPEDIKCVERGGSENAYEVYFQLSDIIGINRPWYKYENGTYNKITDNATFNATLAEIQPALVYKNGMTYYWTDIKHLGAEGKTAQYGVVRNHIYQVVISDITGYGTPVYDGTTDFVIPEKPKDIVSFVSAQINILSWRVVDNTTTLD